MIIKTSIYIASTLILILPEVCAQIAYPSTKKTDQTDNYFGTEVADPYRWLEDDRSDETANWVNAQNKITQEYFGQIEYRNKIKERLTTIWNYPKYSTPFKEGKYYFLYKNDGIQNQSVIYYKIGLEGKEKVFIDPNEFSDEGTTALTVFSISNDAKYAVYGTSSGGSDWNEFFVMEVEGQKKLSDHLKWIKFSGASWKGKGFYYSRYDAPDGSELSSSNEFHKVYYHKLGTSQDNDRLVFQNKNHPKRNYYAHVTEDESFLILYESESTSGSSMYYKNLNNRDMGFTKIADGFDYEYSVVDNFDNKLLVITNKNAPRYKLVLMDPLNPEESSWEEIIPQKEEVLKGIDLVGGKIIARYLKDASSRAYIYSLEGKMERELALPSVGSLSGLTGKKEDTVAFYSYRTFTNPPTVYQYDISSNSSTVYHKPNTKFDLSELVTKQVFYNSKDGTRIPMFIVYHKDAELNGTNPTLLYGYGGFDISITPRFSLANVLFLENGGIYAVANLRGGGEYGEEWHKAGTKLNKQNVFDDFITAAEYLIKMGYTSSDKLAISGRSNGGLLVGACMTQRPDLYKVALPAVGVMDMLRFHKFTIGWAWTGDYGSSDNEEEFGVLYKYSPLHNLKKDIEYPATLVTTADHDDRVVPAHSFKFLATLQENHKGMNPVLGRIETMAGHGAGKPTSKRIEESADILSFIFYNLNMTFNP